MPSGWGWKSIVVALLGAVVGALLEPVVNGLTGRVLIRDGQLWGAVVALFAMSIPNLAQMGRMAVKSDRPAVNLAVGFGLFVVISLLIILIMVGILLGVGRIIGS